MKILSTETSVLIHKNRTVSNPRILQYFMYHTMFDVQKYYIPPNEYIYVFCTDLRTDSDYFPTYHQLTSF